jgi:hypothetical protein
MSQGTCSTTIIKTFLKKTLYNILLNNAWVKEEIIRRM